MTSLSPPTSPGTASDFKPLQRAFADYLRDTGLHPRLTTIDCAERSGRLLLLAEHSSPEIAEPSTVLKDLETAFRDLVPVVGLPEADWALAEALSVRIYLKLRGVPQPYAIHTFVWQPEDALSRLFPVTTAALAPQSATNGAANGALADEESRAASPDLASSLEGEDASANGHPQVGDHPEVNGHAEPRPTLGFSDAALALPAAAVQPPSDPGWAGRGLRSLRDYWSYGLAALILLGSGAFAFALTRPCVVGGCDRLDQAAESYALAQASLATSPTGDDLAQAQGDIQLAIDLLTPVPTWSSHYAAARTDLGRYQGSIVSLNALIQAQTIAAEAANLSQEPPHPVERWVKVHLLWQQAIDWLQAIPTDSPAYDHAQQKLREYRTNHSAIGRRIVAEEEAEANFSTAIQTGNLARQRMDTANSLAGWQLATKEWQAAIKGLSLIPQGTMAYGEAQAQLQDYQQQLSRSTSRSTLEEAGARNYHQAVQAARAAATAEAKSQWTQAVGHWRQAVANAQQIPRDTLLADEGAVLLETYQPALANAQNRLRSAVALQTLTTTLAQMCEFSATPCTVREDANQVRVVLSSQFAEPLRQAITPPAADGTFAFTAQISAAAQGMIEQIITASHQIDRPVAIYDAQGGFVARYRPDLGGFVKN